MCIRPESAFLIPCARKPTIWWQVKAVHLPEICAVCLTQQCQPLYSKQSPCHEKLEMLSGLWTNGTQVFPADKHEGEKFHGEGLLGWYSPTISLLKLPFYGKLSWNHDNQVIFCENTAALSAVCQRPVTGENEEHWQDVKCVYSHPARSCVWKSQGSKIVFHTCLSPFDLPLDGLRKETPLHSRLWVVLMKKIWVCPSWYLYFEIKVQILDYVKGDYPLNLCFVLYCTLYSHLWSIEHEHAVIIPGKVQFQILNEALI